MRQGWTEAGPYDARQCPECKTWVLTSCGPFAEHDTTKTLADAFHWEANHATTVDPAAIGRPYFRYNDEPVMALFTEFAS